MSGHVHDRKILRVSWTPKKTNEWKLLDTAKARKLAYYGEETRGGGKEITQGTMPGARRRGRPRTAWMDNKTCTGLPMEQSVRMTEINGESTFMAWPTLGSRTAKEQNRTVREALQRCRGAET